MRKIKNFIVNYLEELFLLVGLFFVALSGYMLDRIIGLFTTGIVFIVGSNLIIRFKRNLANRRR